MSSTDIPAFLCLAPPGGPDTVYEQTTQARRWHFTSVQLQQMRAAIHAAAETRVRAHRLESDADAPSPDVLLWLGRFYAGKIPGLCRAFRFPLSVDAAACAFFHRFYLRSSPLEHAPKDVMLTCIFLASKTENATLTLKEFAGRIAKGNAPKRPPPTGSDQPPPQAVHAEAANAVAKAVLGLEFTVSQALNFEFAVHGAHRALAGLLLDLALVLPSSVSDTPDDAVKDAIEAALGAHGAASDASTAAQRLSKTLPPQTVEKAYQLLVDARLSDAELLFSPVQIAYAVFRRAVTQAHGQSPGPDPSLTLGRMWFSSLEARAAKARKDYRTSQEHWREAEREMLGGKDETEAPLVQEEGNALGLSFDQLELIAAAVHKQLDALADGRQTSMKPDELRKCNQQLEAFLGNARAGKSNGAKRDYESAGLGTEARSLKVSRTES